MLGGLDSALVSVVSHLVILEGLEHVVGTGLDLANVGFNLVGVLDLNVGQRGLDQVAVGIGTGAGAIIHDLKLHHLFRECGHVVGQAEFVLTGDADRKAKLTLFLLGLLVFDKVIGALDGDINVKRAAGLHGKVEANFSARRGHLGVHALSFGGTQFDGERDGDDGVRQ